MARNRKRNYGNKGKQDVKREQPKKDSDEKRVNFDNERVSRFEKDMEKDHSNDIAWYAKNPEMLKAAGSIGFSNMTGSKLPFTTLQSVPGVMSIKWRPDYASGNSVALNQAKNALYSYVVHANSRNKSYDSNDLMLLILAGNEVFSILGAMIRAFGVMNKFNGVNYYTPSVLVEAMGFKYDDLQDHLSEMWFDINHLLANASQIWIPKNIPLVSRQFWMNSNVYYDAQTPKSQMYLYVQAEYHIYSETTFVDGGSLNPYVPTGWTGSFNPGINGASYTWEQWMTVANDMIGALLNSQDRGIIFGDILKAYGQENLYTINEIPVNYMIEYTYNMEVLSQFENCTPIGENYIGWGLKQNNETKAAELVPFNLGSWTPTNSGLNSAIPNNVVLNFHGIMQPTPEMVMIATRMTIPGLVGKKVQRAANLNEGTNTTNATIYVPAASGTEVPLGITMWTYKYTSILGDKQTPTPQALTFGGSMRDQGSNDSILDLFMNWSAFDWAPWIYSVLTSDTWDDPKSPIITGSPNINAARAFGDWDCYTILDIEDLQKLHTTAVYSEFGVPIIL